MRLLDHLVLPVTTLMLARSRLTGLGFTVAPDARHPFGTGNCCVYLADRSYLEPITILDRNAADTAASEGLLFVKRLKRFTERQGEGFAMVAVRSDDAEADAIRFAAAGLGSGPVFRFARPATLPDGSEGEIGIALAYADDPSAPDATLFACQRIAAEALFQPAYLEHPNGATGLGAAVAVAHEPEVFDRFVAVTAGSREPDEGMRKKTELPSGPVGVLTPAAFRDRYGVQPPDPRRGLLFAALEIVVADLDRTVGYAGPTAIRRRQFIVVPPTPGLSAVLAFRGSDHG